MCKPCWVHRGVVGSSVVNSMKPRDYVTHALYGIVVLWACGTLQRIRVL